VSEKKRRVHAPDDVVVPIFRRREGRGVGLSATPPKSPPLRRRPARVAYMLALALRIEKMIAKGELVDRADAAATFGFTRARITQLLALTLLAPDIQEAILFLEVDDGVERISERSLRPVARLDDWQEQRALWVKLIARGLRTP
jgi:hypothetical protein